MLTMKSLSVTPKWFEVYNIGNNSKMNIVDTECENQGRKENSNEST